MGRCVDLGSIEVSGNVVFYTALFMGITHARELSHCLDMTIDKAVFLVPFACFRVWAKAKSSQALLLEHADLVDLCSRHLEPDSPERSHQEDGRDYLEGRAARGAPPQDEVLAHQRFKVTETLCHQIVASIYL